MDAEFNYRDYTGPIMGERSQQGNWNLNLKQFLTKYRKLVLHRLLPGYPPPPPTPSCLDVGVGESS